MKKQAPTILLIGMLLIGGSCEKFPPSEYEIGQIDLGSAYDLCVDGDYAYVTYNEGLSILDISEKSDPQEIAVVKTSEAAFGILVEGGVAFLGSSGSENLKIINLDDRHHPEVMSSLSIPGTIYGIAKSNNLLFLSTWEGEFVTVDISDFHGPVILSNIECQGNGADLAYYKQQIYYANSQKGLQLIDVEDPEVPGIGITVPSTRAAWDIHIVDRFIYLGKHNQGFDCIEIKDDSSYATLYSKNNGGEVYGIYREGDLLYSADLQNGLEVWDIGNSNNPDLSITLSEYSPHDVVVHNGYVFLADQDRSFVILDIQF